MSRLRSFALAFVAAAVGGVAVPGAGLASPGCAGPDRALPVRLPASIEVTTACAVYTISPRGLVATASRPRVPGGVTWMQIAGPGASVVQRGGRIAVLRGGREVWRSRGRFRANGVFGTLGRGAVAFSYESYAHGRSGEALYVARLGGREHRVAGDERPLGWTAGGRLLSWRFGQGLFALELRRADGSLVAHVGVRLRELRFEPASRTVLALTRSGELERYDGRWQALVDLRRLGFGRRTSFESLSGGLIGLLEGTRAAVLRHDGSLFASARFRRQGKPLSVAGQSGLVANTAGNAVAFAVTSGANGTAVVGRESVYVLRAGDRTARELHRGQVRFAVCERWASLSWHGRWLLYATTEGKTLVLDSRTPERRIDLSRLVARFAHTDAEGRLAAQVQWAGEAGT